MLSVVHNRTFHDNGYISTSSRGEVFHRTPHPTCEAIAGHLWQTPLDVSKDRVVALALP